MTSRVERQPGWGISVYLGEESRNDSYIRAAAAAGASVCFTSCHVPEVPLTAVLAELGSLGALCRQLGVSLIADIAPQVMQHLGCSAAGPDRLLEFALSGVRLDYGFTAADVAAFSQHGQFDVWINTSTCGAPELTDMITAGAVAARMTGCHNFYPRPETGLALGFVQERNLIFASFGFATAAFVPGSARRRGPLRLGLPTVEEHRGGNEGAARQLFASGCQAVLIGDHEATAAELAALQQAVAATRADTGARTASHVALQPDSAPWTVPALPDVPALRLHLLPGTGPDVATALFGAEHVHRDDPAAFVIRSATSRLYARTGPPQPAATPQPRPPGCVTIDNTNYLRYSGEVQIVMKPLPPDPRVNVVGHIDPGDHALAATIHRIPAQKFRLVPAVTPTT